jgi:hypothetical protein
MGCSSLNWGLAALVLASLAVAELGCGAVAARRSVEHHGFLRDYSQLKHHPDYPGREIYINPMAVWQRYDSVQIDSVTLWAIEQTGALTEEERQMLTDLFYRALVTKVGAQFELAERPGPRTLRVRAALTQVKGANVPLRTMTTFIPQALVLGAATSLARDTAVTVGSVTVEAEILDSVTGERLAAAVDARKGVKDITSVRTFEKWGDVEAALEYWAGRLAHNLVGIGVRRKPGAAPVEGG